MSAKQRLKAILASAIALGKAGNFTDAWTMLTKLENDPEIDALGHRTALGLPRQLHSAHLKLAKLQKNSVLKIGYQFNLVPPPTLLAHHGQFTSDERKSIVMANRQAVPRTIHQIWIGPESPPLSTSAWKAHADQHDYDYHLWNEEKLERMQLQHHPVYQHMLAKRDFPGAVDVARYVVLNQMGGIYLDCDWYPARSDISFHDLLPMTGLTTMAEPVPRNTGKGGLLLANSMIATPPAHPVFQRLLNSLDTVAKALPDEPAWWTTGPLVFSLICRGGAITLVDAGFVAGSLPQDTHLAEVQAWCEASQRQDKGLLLAWKSWVWR